MKTAFVQAATMYGIAIVISMMVASLIKGLFLLLHKDSPPTPKQ
jgi:hypothetical protein